MDESPGCKERDGGVGCRRVILGGSEVGHTYKLTVSVSLSRFIDRSTDAGEKVRGICSHADGNPVLYHWRLVGSGYRCHVGYRCHG